MTDEAKKIYDALNDVTVMCAECQHYGEPFGCNRRGGSCIAYDFILDATDLIERLSTELEQVKRERDAAVRDLKLMDDLFREDPEMCCFCKHVHADPDEEPCNSCNPNPLENKWQWRGVFADNRGGDEDAEN